MIAIEWLRRGEGALSPGGFAQALAAGSAKASGQFAAEQFQAAELLAFSGRRRALGWRPVEVGPLTVLFSGHLDNPPLAELDELGADWTDPRVLARLYAKSRLRWGAATDRRLIGEYAVIELDRSARTLRLVRSPLRAPPLQYHAGEERVIAASVPRAIHAAGLPVRLNEAKLADHGLFNFSDPVAGWFVGIERVPLGTEVVFTPGESASRLVYDLRALPKVRMRSDSEYLEAAHSLLSEGTRAALHGCKRPGVMLSGGLDSPIVAAKALAELPPDGTLRSYTFTVEPEWDGFEFPGQFGNERPLVEAFAAMYPRLEARFFDNAGSGFDAGLAEMHFATGSGAIHQTNFSQFHALWRAARSDGCDRILMGDFGNYTFSTEGYWGFVEYFLTGRWRQLYLALRDAGFDERPLWRRFITNVVMPLLPEPLFRWQRAVRGMPDVFALASPLNPGFARESGALERAARAGLPRRRSALRARWDDFCAMQGEDMGEHSDLMHGFEQIYGISQRDPTAYRPFAEFCFGLPTPMFLRDGQTRWLAREMGRGILPEPQRINPAHGVHNADWHVKLGRMRKDLLGEIDRLAASERLASILDFDKVRAALEDWPEDSSIPHERRLPLEAAATRAVALARYVNFVEGRNA
ncbi:MAG: hypothetical protein H6916_05820 [Novosphingobium sp.]|uniref:asparagine synthase-related protein n=1 Tax=Novosphingobium sp. TaxID=1874826 RepID=UPI002607DA7E|nr:asparagine synthase-related protein [Novosphingobium sp.]MCP5386320.1 hypothetical protein [Novosphingobium sp.]